MRTKKAQKVGEKLSLLLACEKYKRTGWSGRDSRSLGVRHSTVVNISFLVSRFPGFHKHIYVSRFLLDFSAFDNFLGGSFSPGCFTFAGLFFFNVDGNLLYGFYGDSMGVKIYNFPKFLSLSTVNNSLVIHF